MATATESLDEATFEVLGAELGYKIQMVSPEDEDKELLEGFGLDLEAELDAESEDDLEIRPPVVTVMGHVDHGKTRLLDAIRQTNVVSGEAGGITQHIGAYQVWTEHEGIERAITFIDTPGHEAFTAMRARGAQVTDMAILVVAADDGIMPQTVEALNHAQAAGVPIVVAVNKVDKPDANPAKVRQQLTEYGLVAEEYGGDVQFVDVSARAGTGIQHLLDAVLLTADAGLDLTANPNKAARGVAIEAKLDKGRGSIATVLIQSGTLRVGDSIVAGTAYGRVRAMIDENGDAVEEAYPSRPVQVQGLDSVPRAGDTFIVTDEDRLARQIAEKREAAERNAQLAKARKRISLEDFTRALEEGKVESLNLIIKGDVSGAVEALEESLLKIEVDDSVQLRIIHRGVGAVTESDVNLATIDNAIVIGFNVRPDAKARERAAAKASTSASTRSSTTRSTTSSSPSRVSSSRSSKRFSRVSPRSARCSAPRSSATSPVSSSAPARSRETPRRASSATVWCSPMVWPSSRCVVSRTTSPRFARTSKPVSASASSTTSRSVTRSRPPR